MMWKGRQKQRSCFCQSVLLTFAMLIYSTEGKQYSPDSRGREFIISFMENEGNSGSNWKFVDLFIGTASVTDVSVNISAPRLTAAKLNENFHITFGQVKHLKLDEIVINEGSKMSSKGIYISATDEIIVFSINRQSTSTDGFLAFPLDVLGYTHYAVCFSYDSNKRFFSNIVVVGVEDNTKLTIQLSNNNKVRIYFDGKTYRHDQWINITLNTYDTLQLETLGDLTGSFIEGDRPIAVFTGNKKTDLHFDGRQNGFDHLVEQIPSTLTWGKEFMTIPFPERGDGYVLRFVTSEDHTSISIVGCVTKTFILNKRSFRQENIPNSNCFLVINSTKPILIAQFSKSSDGKILSDPSMFIVPPVEQYAADYVISSPPATSSPFFNYFLIMIKASQKDGLIVDGKCIQSVQAKFEPIQGTDFVGGFVYVGNDTKPHTIKHKSPISVFGAVAYGGATWESYSFPVGLRMAPINQVCKTSKMTIADGIDNDCDRLIDEEICNGNDDDGDLSIDEDCAATDPYFTTTTGQTSVFVHSASDTTLPSSKNTQTVLTSKKPTTASKKVKTSPLDQHHNTMSSTMKTQNFSIGHPTHVALSEYSDGKQLISTSTTAIKRTVWMFPRWLKVLEAVILGTICCVILGVSICLCKRILGMAGRRNRDDEEEKIFTVWKKERPLPVQRRH